MLLLSQYNKAEDSSSSNKIELSNEKNTVNVSDNQETYSIESTNDTNIENIGVHSIEIKNSQVVISVDSFTQRIVINENLYTRISVYDLEKREYFDNTVNTPNCTVSYEGKEYNVYLADKDIKLRLQRSILYVEINDFSLLIRLYVIKVFYFLLILLISLLFQRISILLNVIKNIH